MSKHSFSRYCCLVVSSLLLSLGINAQQRDETDALKVAQDFVSGSQVHKVKGLQGANHVMKLLRRNANRAYYIYAIDEDEGFVIVSGDERMVPVLGYSYTTPVTEEAIPENVQNWLDLYEEEYLQLQNGNVRQMPMLKASEQSDVAVSPIVSAMWGQGSPFNNDCPTYNGSRCLTGCVATAVSQIMYSFRYPECGNGAISYKTETNNISLSDNLANHPFDWSNITDTYSSSSTSVQKSAVANLCYMVGLALSMDYGIDGSSSNSISAMSALAGNFGYDRDMTFRKAEYMTQSEWHKLLQDELHQGHPLLYSASSATDGGHSFILDGYTPPTSSSDTPYYHINWGWNGSYNGDYALTSFIAGGYNFSESHEVIAGIQKEDNQQTVNSYWSGTGSLSTANMKSTSVSPVTCKLEVYNNAYRSFTGKIIIKVVAPDGTSRTISTSSASGIAINYGKIITASFTPDGTVGTYTFEAYTSADGKSTEERIDISGNMTLTVLSGEEDLPYMQTDVQATSMEINSCTSNSVSITLSDIINMATDAFTGDIRIAVADTEGNLIGTFGTGTSVSALGHYSSLTYPRTLSAAISGVADGQYRLYAASCQSGYSGWTLVRKWTVSGNTITSCDKPLYTDIWIKNGCIYLSDPDKEGSKVKISVNISGSGSVNDDEGNTASGTAAFYVAYGSAPTLHFVPGNDMQLTSAEIDGAEVISYIGDLSYALPTLTADLTVNVKYASAIDFWKNVQFTYDESSSSVSRTSSGAYASGSKLKCLLSNNSGVTIIENYLSVAEGANGTRESNMLSGTKTLDSNYTRTWTLTLGKSYTHPVVFETFRVRGEEYTMSCGPDYANGIITVTRNSTGEIVGIYSLDGRRVSADSKGVKIYRYSDGRTEKRF